MAVQEVLEKVPYWRAVAIALMGATIIIWLQGSVNAAITVDNQQDYDRFAPKEALIEIRERLVRIETMLERGLDRR